MTTARLPVWRHLSRRHLKRMLANIGEREFIALAEGAAADEGFADFEVFREVARLRQLELVNDTATAH
ncbi:hypothetical protein IYW40_07355 [Methylocystis sp. H4A]|uniref:hypothetical protein n=1 Tax=Methylocystis sp. H4A TaxID=2785788 RepID=UPI0018C2AC12|nr:hypothetical protein [Methylocystis sp. H4A]MBG0801297.1 hypothetical protein [Methylocystis sp. H4A]